MSNLLLVRRTLSSAFIDEGMFRAGIGGDRNDLSTVARYLQLPVAERPVLSLYFDREYYFASNPDVKAAGVDPLLHFVETGLAEMRAPHPLIDIRYIAGHDPHALGEPPQIEALGDFLEYDLGSPSAYFDIPYYSAELKAEAPPNGLLRHLLTVGLWSGRQPNALFAPGWYAERHPDVPDDLYQALRHFVMFGDAEGRKAGPNFDGAAYRARYPDVTDAGVPPLAHFLRNGRYEGRYAATERAAETAAHAGPSVPVAQAVPIDPDGVLHAYAAMRARLDFLRHKQKEVVRVAPPAMVKATTTAGDIARLRLPAAASPRVSVLIPVFNELDYTLECLLALQQGAPAASYEVVIADDCSTDSAVSQLAGVENLVYLCGPENVGFLRNTNAGFRQCRGDYVLLLNNDTQILPGAIDRLVAVLDAMPDVAAAGPKMIYPNGRLQEAGCFLRPNGESGMVGLFGDPSEGGYSHDRDVAYCSGAALLFRRALIEGDLLDEAFRPAYCEDADLCLRFIAAGHRIRYVHDAVVVHHLSVSSNRQSVTRKLRTILRNQHHLLARWGDTIRRMDAVRPIAFYLPQFHPTPENDLWWGKGFTEWTNVAKARPCYEGHYQPHLPADLGFYDLRAKEVLAQQAELAARYGLAGFCVYYYNFGSRRVLSRPLDVVRASPEIAFNYCLCWANENWTKHWDGGTREILLEQSYDEATLSSIIADVVEQAADPRYLRVNGKPIFLVYRPLLIPAPAAFAAAARAAFAAAGFPGVQLVYVESMEAVDKGLRPADLGFDACVEFPPQGRAVPAITSAEIVQSGWSGFRYDYSETALSFIGRESVPYTRYPAVFPSWDNTPRQALKGTCFDGYSPEAFRFYIEEKIEEIRAFLMGDERLLFVNAWNEWAEGAHLEPDTGFGHRWLEALRDAVAAKQCA